MSKISVSVNNFPSLFKLRQPMTIPDYQRPYVWGKEKSEELLIDLEEFFLKDRNVSSYYMGSILLYRNKEEETLEIIDGQQRITTLLLMKYQLDQNLDLKHNLKFNSHLSFKSIRETKAFFETQADMLQKLAKENFFNHLEFTIIITTTEDEAFTFFDTQNNRGIKLSATDFLKAYHLRAVNSENLQEISAKHWENAQSNNKTGTFMDFMFDEILWRARNWRGNKSRLYDNKDKQIKETFQKDTLQWHEEDSYPVYSNFSNKRIEKISWNASGTSSAIEAKEQTKNPVNFPFSIRQPIYKGINFFKYTEKYIAVYETLFVSKNSSIEINKLRDFTNEVYNDDMSEYLRHFIQLCLVFYFDNFGENRIYEAVLCFDFALGSIRLSKQQVKREAPYKFLNENTINLFDLISGSFLPDEVFNYIYHNQFIQEIYSNEDIEDNIGVQGRYKHRIKNYFGKKDKKLSFRKEWKI